MENSKLLVYFRYDRAYSLSLSLSLSLFYFVLGVFLLHIFVTEVFLRLGVGVTFSGSADVEV